jgi:hypothetical protein
MITPQQTLAVLNKLTNSLHFTLVLTASLLRPFAHLKSFPCAGRTYCGLTSKSAYQSDGPRAMGKG